MHANTTYTRTLANTHEYARLRPDTRELAQRRASVRVNYDHFHIDFARSPRFSPTHHAFRPLTTTPLVRSPRLSLVRSTFQAFPPRIARSHFVSPVRQVVPPPAQLLAHPLAVCPATPSFCQTCSTLIHPGRSRAHSCLSQRSLHDTPIFRLLLKVAVNGTHQCDSFNFCGSFGPQLTIGLAARTLDHHTQAYSTSPYSGPYTSHHATPQAPARKPGPPHLSQSRSNPPHSGQPCHAPTHRAMRLPMTLRSSAAPYSCLPRHNPDRRATHHHTAPQPTTPHLSAHRAAPQPDTPHPGPQRHT